jgi:GT2 family glycosyltransferase
MQARIIASTLASAQPGPMTLSIVIVNWNSKEFLRKCLESIRETRGGLATQVIVVDGGSFDGCREMLEAEFPEVEFIQSPDNIGFGRCNNLGFELVTGENLLLLNPDTELLPGSLGTLLDEIHKRPEAGMIGARLLNTDGSLQYSAVHPLPSPWNAAFDSDRSRRRWWNAKGRRTGTHAFEVEAISGACMMMRSDTFRKVGGFDTRFFMYAEDMDLCYRIHQTGLKILHAPQAVVTHHGGGSSGTQFSKFSTVMIREALAFYFKTHHGPASAILYRMLIMVSAGVRIPCLCAVAALGSAGARASSLISIAKWWTLLRWALGREDWSAVWFRLGKAADTPAKA